MLDQIKEIICEIVDFDKNSITEDSSLKNDIHLNSYEFMCFIGKVEETFDIRVKVEEVVQIKSIKTLMPAIDTVRDVMDYITSKQQRGDLNEK